MPITSLLAAAGLTVNPPLTPAVKPLVEETVNCLLLPAASIRKLVKVAVPFPTPSPMFKLSVPCSGPVPPVRAAEIKLVAGSPFVELLPN